MRPTRPQSCILSAPAPGGGRPRSSAIRLRIKSKYYSFNSNAPASGSLPGRGTLSAYSPSAGSSIFNSIGATGIAEAGGASGQVSLAQEGTATLFAAFTGWVGNHLAVETAISVNRGASWHVTYSASPTLGAVSNPQVTTSPEGPFFATWQDDGSGTSEVDIAVFGDSGQLVVNSSAIRGAAARS